MVNRTLGLETVQFSDTILIFSSAWLLGTVMPGASAGIGVREAVIIALGQFIAGTDLSVSAIILRLITVSADLVIWGVCATMALKTDSGKIRT